MKAYIDCIPCFFRQCIEASRMAGADDSKVKRIVDEVGYRLRDFTYDAKPPELALMVHSIIRAELGNGDYYENLKQKSNFWALSIYSQLKEAVKKAQDPLLKALEIAIAGNMIDYGANSNIDFYGTIDELLKEKKKEPFQNGPLIHYDLFKDHLKDARNILYLSDNAGEAVFDRVLIETIKEMDDSRSFIYAVRDKPIINDCLETDAVKCGIGKCASIVSSGCEAPGILQDHCSPRFKGIFNDMDMIISKGQGNFEGLMDSDKIIFHLFITKCPVMGNILGVNVKDPVLLYSELFESN